MVADSYYCTPVWFRSIVMSMSVCLRSHNLKTPRLNYTKFLWMLAAAVARSSSGGVELRYVLLVVRMTSCFSYHGTNVHTVLDK